MDWFKGKNRGKHHGLNGFNGKINGFPLRFSLENQSIEY